MRTFVIWLAIGSLGTLLAPATASAQGAEASISGLVQDSTGAVLPGVTVDVSSPVMIEQTRSAATDGAGRYSIVSLRPGTYSVTFTLAGFRTVRREGILLEGAFAAQVNASLSVGAVEETVTVAGDAPVVDVQTVRKEFVVNRDILDALPVARNLSAQMAIIPGASGLATAGGVLAAVHGSSTSESYFYNDGMRAGQNMVGTGVAQGGWSMSETASAELVYAIGSQSAEYQVGGVAMNAIPREGGNTFSGSFVAYGNGSFLQSDNRSEDQQALIRKPNKLIHAYEFDGSFGGPIKRNKLWFFGGGKKTENKSYAADVFNPDGSQAVSGPITSNNMLMRLTYQATPRNKFKLSFDKNAIYVWNASVGAGTAGSVTTGAIAPEASNDILIPQTYAPQLKWTAPVTTRLLLEAGLSEQYFHFRHQYHPGVGPLGIAHSDLTTGLLTVATNSRVDNLSNGKSALASMSYVTGSHTVKVGYNHRWGYQIQSRPYHGDIIQLSFLGSRSISASTLNTPVNEVENLNFDDGLYGQDRWTINRFTFNLGARWDHFNASIPAQSSPAGRFVPARSFPAIENIPKWNDWATRTGVAYDVFGTGKTALKANLAKFVAGSATDFTAPYNPMGQQIDSRSWTDLDGNGLPLDADGNVQFAELGPTTNTQFGLRAASRLAPNTPRGHNWEQNLSFQHELYPRIAVTVGYYRRQFYNLTWTDNVLADSPSDYTTFTFVGPSDPRLPNGGAEVITMYNLNPAKLGLVDNVVRVSDTRTSKYNGFEVSSDLRLPGGAFLRASATTERTETYNCQVSNPNALRFCHVVPPFRTLFKTSGSYQLPYAFQASAVFQAQPAPALGATYAVSSAIAGVPITGGGTLSVQLVEPGKMYAGYFYELDLRLARNFKFGRNKVRGYVDVFNLLNNAALTTQVQTFGPSWLRPTAIQTARNARFGVQVDF